MTPPIRNEGSIPRWSSIEATIDEVVVLPWVPAMAIVWAPTPSAASIFARGHTAIPSARARASSGLVSGMADEVTTTSGATSSMVDASCPMRTGIPASSRSRT